MCLYATPERTIELKKRLAKTGKIRCWKVLNIGEDYLASMWYHRTWSPGPNNSDSKEAYLGLRARVRNHRVSRGIHVYTDKKRAMGHTQVWQETVPVTCYMQDLVAGGDSGEAVFKKVYLSKRAYNKATQ